MDKTNALSLRGDGTFRNGPTLTYLIDDEFTDTVAAGSVNGTAATPGPGTRTVTDTDSDGVSVGSGVLAIANPNSTYGDPGIYYAQQTRATGLAVISKMQFTSVGTAGFGMSSAVPGGPAIGADFSTGTIRFFPGAMSVGSASQSTYYTMALVLRGTGHFVFIKGGAFTSWSLLYVSVTNSANLYPMLSTYSATSDANYLRVIQLPAPFDTDDGIATDVLSGSVAAGTTFTHEADCLIEFTVDTLPSVNQIRVNLRSIWQVRVTNAGDFILYENLTARGSVFGVVSNGHRIVVVADGETIKGYYNNTLAWTYSSASASATATAGEVAALGTGGVVSDLKTWPRELDGIAASVLNKVSVDYVDQPRYLMRDEYTDTVAAGSVNGTAATPGPGTRTVVDTDGDVVSVGGGLLSFDNLNSSFVSHRVVYEPAVSRTAGTAIVSKILTPGEAGALIIGWRADATSYGSSGSFYFRVGVNLDTFADPLLTIASYGQNQAYEIVSCLRTSGSFMIIRGGSYADWTLLWVNVSNQESPLYTSVTPYSLACDLDHFRVVQLPSPFNGDDGLATDVLSGSVSAGATFEHEADCLIEATITTVPSADNIDIVFRQQDASNYWICRVTTGGSISLQEVVAGSPTQRGLSAAVVFSGHRVVVIADGTTIKVYSNNTLRIAYSSASTAATATAGEVDALGTSGAVSNLKTWPRTLSGIAADLLDEVSA